MLLTIDNISKAYGDHQVLNSVTFGLPPGQKLGLVGANGAGKSTLLKIMAGKVPADKVRLIWLAALCWRTLTRSRRR